MTHATQVLQSHDLSQGIWHLITHILFLTTQGHGGPPRMSIISVPGPPPRQHKHERWYTPPTNLFILTRRIWNDDCDGQMIFGDFVGLKLPDICLTGEERPPKNLSQETCPDRASNPGPLSNRRSCYRLLHSGEPNWYYVQYCINNSGIRGSTRHFCLWKYLIP